MAEKFYITTAIPYVNAAPHIGHALEFVQADTLAKHHRLLGQDVCLLSGGDENALKNVQAAEKAGILIQKFVDTNTQLFANLASKLNVRFDIFQKGSDQIHHYLASQKLWNLCDKNEDIYKKKYEGLYCIGCEAFYSSEDLNENGECFEHPGKKLEKISEENYFFRLSRYQQQLIDIISRNELKIVPDFRKNEILSFLKQPLKDISISRSNVRAHNWGVPVPDDVTQRIYVWFDALNIYQSGIGFNWNEGQYHKWWPADVHVIGKGISRFHAIYWPAFLLSAKLKLPKTIFIHGYFTINGQKMGKSLGNVIDPIILINKYGSDALRYYFLREIPPFSDGDFSETRFKELYNADLANGLGNLIARVAKLASITENLIVPNPQSYTEILKTNQNFEDYINKYQFNDALLYIWGKIKTADVFINTKKPWETSDKALTSIINPIIGSIQEIALLLQPFLPDTAEKILKQFSQPAITVQPSLFPRIK